MQERRRRRRAEEDAEQQALIAEVEASVAEDRASAWRSIGLPADAWPAIRDRWSSDPELGEYMARYPLGLLPDARLKSLLLAGDYVALRTETDRAEAEEKAKSDAWYRQRVKCPRCRIGVGVHRLVGLPTQEGHDAARRGDVILAGCIAHADDREWECKLCGNEWGRTRLERMKEGDR